MENLPRSELLEHGDPMSVQIGAAPNIGKRTRVLKKGNFVADGTEQLLAEFEGEGKVSGSVDLHQMTLEDKIVVRQYFKILSTSDYQKYAEENYEGFQESPLVYFPEKVTETSIKTTLQQTEGVYRIFQHSFTVEE